ncbi:MAG: serine/threonine protein kinase [Clostridia bacterium]|nr:serine/threonine protein kinase [Clostridia bacterium]
MDINYYKKYEPIGGKWHITRELGRGSYGVVYEVERKDYGDTKSAMKILSIPSHPGEVENFKNENYDLDEKSVRSHFYAYVEDFVKEFQLMSKLRGHSNIVSYEDHDVIEKEGEIGWDIFIRMELLTPLHEFLAGKTVNEAAVIRLGIDMCEALKVCENNKIIHRDIKPSNIFVSPTGSYKLGDFGVARTMEKAACEMSKKGTYTYMAPEVFRGEEYDMTVDIYSLGIVMYKLLNNNLEPFRTDRVSAGDDSAMTRRMKGEAMPNPANCSDKLAKIILKACAYKPEFRYQSAEEMKKDLVALFGNAETPTPGTETSAPAKTVSGTAYDAWVSSSNVLFKSIDSDTRWRCPRCDMANDNRDAACFVCGCQKSVYVQPARKKDSFATDLNDHHASATIRTGVPKAPIDMRDINAEFRRRSEEKPYIPEEKSTGKGVYIGIAIFLVILIIVAALLVAPALN